MTYRRKEFYLEEQGVSGNHLLAELDVVYLHEVSTPALGLLERVQYEQSSALCHSLNLQHSRHYRFLGEVSGKERLVAGDVLQSYDAVRTYGDNFIDELHRIAVWKQFADAVYVHYRRLVGVVEGCLHLVLAYLLTHKTCKLVVYGMSGTCSNDAPLDRFADESHIADDVKQFMTCTLVVPDKGLVLYVSQFRGVHARYSEEVGKFVELVLFQLSFVDNDGVVHIAALDKVGAEQRLYVANEYKGSCRSDIGSKLVHIVEGGKLAAYELRVEGAHCSN